VTLSGAIAGTRTIRYRNVRRVVKLAPGKPVRLAGAGLS
jgi:hypothetical protein